MVEPLVLPFGAARPSVAESAFVAPGAVLIGDVRVGDAASVWYTTVVRADGDSIEIGARSNLQDGCVVHADPGVPVVVGADVSVGHGAVLHGCRIGDGSLIGMSATVLNGADVGAGCLVAAGTVVLEGATIPAGHLVAGTPGKVRRPLTDAEREGLRANAAHYVELAVAHAGAVGGLS